SMGNLAIVTGGGRGIGAAICQRLAAAGHDLCVNFQSDRARAEAVAASCRELGVQALAVQADVGDSAAVEAMFAQCDAVFGAPSILVNNAGVIGRATRLATLTDAVLEETFRTNVFG